MQSSFDAQWRRYAEGSFERELVYAQSEQEELAEFFDAIGTSHVDGARILNAGCGSGRLGQSLASFGATTVNVDEAGAIWLFARRAHKPNLFWVQTDLNRPGLRSKVFDYVWSQGVIHHCDDTESVFDNLSRLVKPGGKLAIWVYSRRTFSSALFVRKVLPFSYALPERVNLALSWIFAVPISATAPIRGVKLTWRYLKATQFGLYDSLTPRWVKRYSYDHVRHWFESRGFHDIRKWSELGVTGTKL